MSTTMRLGDRDYTVVSSWREPDDGGHWYDVHQDVDDRLIYVDLDTDEVVRVEDPEGDDEG